jgi:hypothetical protein
MASTRSLRTVAKLLDEYKDTVAGVSSVLTRRTVDSWSVKDPDILALERFLESYPRKMAVLDVGTFFGVSAFFFASHPKVSEVFSVDLNPSMAELCGWLDKWGVPLGSGSPPDMRLLDVVEAALTHFPEQRQKIQLRAGHVGSVGVPVPPDDAALLAFVDGDHAKESVEADLKTIFGNNPHAIAILHDCRGYHGLSVLAGVESFVEAAQTKYRFQLFQKRFGRGPYPPNLGIVYADVEAAEIERASVRLLLEDPTSSLLEVASASWKALNRQRARADRQQARADRQQARVDRLEAELREARRT